MLRGFLVIVLLGVLAVGCAKKADLPAITVSAANLSEFTRFRSELGGQFPAERLKDFDTAVQELKLDAMNRDVAPAEARELDMLAAINAKSVHAATLLGWQARLARFQREIAEIDALLQYDLKIQQNAGAKGPSATVLARIQSAGNVLSQLQRNAEETERHLKELSASPQPGT